MSPIRAEERARYPKNWREISRKVRERAMGRCECSGECGRDHEPFAFSTRCAAVNGHYHPDTNAQVVLTVAHLDHTPENCDDTNLRAMCNACHLTYDAPHHAETAARTRAANLATWMDQLPGLEVAR